MMRTVLALAMVLLCAATGVLSQPDTTPCDANGAYNPDTGTATCGGFGVSVKKLVCGDGFSQARCVAKWVNGGGENEWYFFMGAGSGMSASMLPASCSGLPSGLAMIQYYPDKQSCYPASDLAGTTIAYTAGSSSTTPASITLNFAEHDDGSDTRNGYIKIACNDKVTDPTFTTIGDSNQASFYQVDTTAPCGGMPPPGPPPGQDYRCLNNVCVNTGAGTGISNATCAASCGPTKSWACVKSRCVPAASGGTRDECMKLCKP